MNQIKIISAILFSVGLLAKAQDTHWSQFDLSPLSLNPAQAGVQADIRAVANYRNQWSSVSANPYSTYGASCDWAMMKKPGRPVWLGLGVSFYNDKAGDGQMGTMMGNVSLSGVVPMEKSRLSAGIMCGYNQKSLNTGSLTWENQFNGFAYDASRPSYENYNNPGFAFLNTSGGINYYYSKTEHYMTANDEVKVNVGLSFYHFNTPRQSFKNVAGEKLFSKMVLYGNFSYGVPNSKICLLPSFVYMMQGPSRQFNGGLLLKYIITEASHYTHIKKPCAISGGGFYRASDAFIAQMLFEYDRYVLGFGYDLNLSRLKVASKSMGGFEVNFRFNIIHAGSSKSRM
jgi:type IX secretion system PorP/SprF family membrane protein